MVYYDPTQYPSNRQIISTIAADPNGLIPDTANTAGMFTLADLNAARASVGLPPAPICDPNNADLCGDAAPATLLQVANSTLYVLTFNDGAVITGFASLTPNITYPDPSPDDFYVGTFNGSYGLGNTPAMTGDNDVTFSIYNNFLPNQTWGMDVLSTFSNTTPNAKVTGISLVGINNGAPFQILNLTDRINLNDPNINGIGAHSDDGKTSLACDRPPLFIS